MYNQRIAARFLEIAEQLERIKVNPYRVRAYRRGARSLSHLKDDVATLSQRGHLERIPGIGPDLANKIAEFIETGKIADPSIHQEFPDTDTRELPKSFQDLITTGILDQKIARILCHRFYIESLDDLERLVRSHILRTLPNFGVQWEQRILSGLESLRREKGI
jgi:DNA polymerase (family X)